MPKKAPEVVYELRFSLQDREKEMAEQFLTAWSFNKVAEPVVNLMNDVTGLAAFLSLLALITGFTFLASEDLSVSGLIDAYISQRDQAIAAGLIGVAAPGIGIGGLIAQWLGLLGEGT